jgi:hypothetical protein
MGELYAEQAESAPAEKRGAAASGRAHGAQTCAVTSTPATTSIADIVEAMLYGGPTAAVAQTVNQKSILVEHHSESNPSQNREVAGDTACNAAGAP